MEFKVKDIPFVLNNNHNKLKAHLKNLILTQAKDKKIKSNYFTFSTFDYDKELLSVIEYSEREIISLFSSSQKEIKVLNTFIKETNSFLKKFLDKQQFSTKNNPIQIRVLLLNPYSKMAKQRSMDLKQSRNYARNEFFEGLKNLEVIYKSHIKKSSIELEVKFSDSIFNYFLFGNEKAYLQGRLRFNKSLVNDPMIETYNIDSSIYDQINMDFESIWNKAIIKWEPEQESLKKFKRRFRLYSIIRFW